MEKLVLLVLLLQGLGVLDQDHVQVATQLTARALGFAGVEPFVQALYETQLARATSTVPRRNRAIGLIGLTTTLGGALRELKVGPSKGYAIAHEFAALLEATSRVDPDKIDLANPAYETDVLIIGGGGAGTSAAILAPASAIVPSTVTTRAPRSRYSVMYSWGVSTGT